MRKLGQLGILLIMILLFLAAYFMPVEHLNIGGWYGRVLFESLALLKYYAREHVILCLVPAFFIAGAICVFISKGAVTKYFGAGARKSVAYGVASISGAVLAVCSCTVLPLFTGIYRMGAGLGPAVAFLYSGPAINVLAIILTMRVLGKELGIARAVGAVLFSVVLGLLMHAIFRDEGAEREGSEAFFPEEDSKPLWQNALILICLVSILVFANLGRPESVKGLWYSIYSVRWVLVAISAAALALNLTAWFQAKLWKAACLAVPVIAAGLLFGDRPVIVFAAGAAAFSFLAATGGADLRNWLDSSWSFSKQILPLLFAGILIAGSLLGRPGHEALVPSSWIERAVGGNSIQANLFASIAGAFMYFATLTEVPILQGLIGAGMGKGPALALLLAGPALSLPNMLVIRSVLGTRKTLVFVLLVIIMATLCGIVFGVITK